MKTKTFLLLALTLLAAPVGAAQAQSSSTNEDWVPVRHLEFTAEDVEGGVLGPDGELIVTTERAHHPSLIEIREGFEAEIAKMLEDQ